MAKPPLVAEICGSEKGPIVFDKGSKNKIQFILRASEDVYVFEDWNSWGYFSRFFTARDKTDPNLIYTFGKITIGWDANYPSTLKIKAGESLTTNIDLRDGNWQCEPPLKTGADHHLLVQGHFVEGTSDPGGLSKTFGEAWKGQLVTNTIEITIKKNCVGAVNNLDFFERYLKSIPKKNGTRK